ncbi:MAG TPA: glutamate--tRNA ligase family protein [Pyrinomonadaceae bacterium]|jgi:Glutamyl- and glutaminyl-tRNA synthetases|nr:glutamate--tRNA ligase family protein [Pyrinomonadaceae bacterium]
MLNAEFINTLFDAELPEPSHWESSFPPRNLPPDAIVTRFGPSPTGFLHTGGVYVANLGKNLAHHSGGSYFIRIEDTDQAREVPGSREQFARGFKYFDIESDENDSNSKWGPYEQSKRELIYHTYARELLRTDRAYLCFCTREELAQMSEEQLAAKLQTGYYGSWARCRNLTQPEVMSRIEAGKTYTIRFRSPGGPPRRVEFLDLIRGRIEHQDNVNDIVLLKGSDQSPRLPTYHFAHVVDDTLMRVTVVLRGEEWISSVPVHLQLFNALGFEPIPYAHIAPLMKFDGASRRKLSKRKDNEADVAFYIESGYPAGAVLHYLRGLANSRFAEMTFEESASAALSLNECGVAGPIFDLVKLESISREFIAQLPTEEALQSLLTWARDYDPELAAILSRNLPLARRIFANERQPGVMQRKDLAKWGEFRPAYGLYFEELFPPVSDPSDPRFAPVKPDMVVKLAKDFADSYRHEEDKEVWFEQIRSLAATHGFAPTAGQYKKNPENFAGSISHVSNAIRIALTGLKQSPELFLVAHNLGEEEVLRRVRALTTDPSGPA